MSCSELAPERTTCNRCTRDYSSGATTPELERTLEGKREAEAALTLAGMTRATVAAAPIPLLAAGVLAAAGAVHRIQAGLGVAPSAKPAANSAHQLESNAIAPTSKKKRIRLSPSEVSTPRRASVRP